MKKFTAMLIASSLLFTSVTSIADAQGYTKSINYIGSKETIKKVKNGTMSLHGMKIGDKLSKFQAKKYKDSHHIVKDFYTESGVWITKSDVGYDKGFTDFQENKKFSQLKITRLNDDYFNSPHNLYKKQIRKYYGKPSKNNSLKIGNRLSGRYQVDVYKNVTFIYMEDMASKSNPRLTYVILMKNNTPYKLNQWKKYLKDEQYNRLSDDFKHYTIKYDSYGKFTTGR